MLRDVNSIIRFVFRSVEKDRGIAEIFCSLDVAGVSESDKWRKAQRKVFKMKAEKETKGKPG